MPSMIVMCRALWRELGLRRGRDVRLELNSLGQPDERARAPRRAGRALRGSTPTRSTRTRGAACTATRCASSTARTRRCSRSIEAAPQLIDFLGAGVAGALRRACARCSTPPASPTASTRAWCAAWTTTTSPCSSGSPTSLGAQGTVCGGGRYDGLFEQLGGKPAPAVGCGHGHRAAAAAARGGRRADAAPPRPTSTRSCPAPPRCRARCAALRGAARRRRRGADACRRRTGGSMKAQFKKADASGARYALIFGDDELARGEVAVKPLRDAAGGADAAPARRRRRLGRASCATHNPPLCSAASRTARMATHLDLEEQEQLDQLKAFWKQYGNLITWVLIARARRLRRRGTAGTAGSATRRAKAGAMYDELDARGRRPATPTAPARVFADLKERYPRTAFAAAGRPAGRQAAVREGPGRRRARQRSRGWPTTPPKTNTERSRALRLAGAAARREAVRRGAEAARRRDARQEFDALVGRPPRRHPAGAGQARRGQGRLPARPGTAMDAKVDYRRLVEAKLNALGVAPAAQRRSGAGARPSERRPSRAALAPRPLAAAARSLAAAVRPVRAARQAQADAARADRRRRSPAAPVWNAEHRQRSQFPLRRRASTAACHAGRERRQRASRSRRTAAASSGARASAPSCRAGVGSDGRIAAVVTRDNELVALEAGAGQVAQARSASRVATRAAGGRRARLRARRRPHRAGLRRADGAALARCSARATR